MVDDYKDWAPAERVRHYTVVFGEALCGAKVPNHRLWLQDLDVFPHRLLEGHNRLHLWDCPECQTLAREIEDVVREDHALLQPVLRERVQQKIAQIAERRRDREGK